MLTYHDINMPIALHQTMMTAASLLSIQPELNLPETALRRHCLSLNTIGPVVPCAGTFRSRASTLVIIIALKSAIVNTFLKFYSHKSKFCFAKSGFEPLAISL
jgi:hypothetical protein